MLTLYYSGLNGVCGQAIRAGHPYSVLVSADGRAYACGYGRNGRLGLGGADVCMYPRAIPALAALKCVAVAAARCDVRSIVTAD